MYAVICSPKFFNQIEQAIDSKGEQILIKTIGNDIDITAEFDKIFRVAVKYLIIDISVIEDHKKFLQLIRRYRIMNDKTQIIIIAPNCQPGNYTLHMLVTMGIYDIIVPAENSTEDTIISSLLKILENPSPYKKAVKWVIDDSFISELKNEEKMPSRERIRERTVTITKEKIIGTVVIAVAGTIRRIGTTHMVISLAEFLKEQNFKVAVIEFHKSECFNIIKNAYEDSEDKGDYFILDGIHFYPYDNNFNILHALEQDFNYIILDMGIYNQCLSEEFRRANLKIIVSGVKDWELLDLESILRIEDNAYKNYYLFNFADKYTYNLVKSSMEQLKCFKAPYNPNPFDNKECYSFFRLLLKDVLPEYKQTSSKIFTLNKIKQLFPIFSRKHKEERA